MNPSEFAMFYYGCVVGIIAAMGLSIVFDTILNHFERKAHAKTLFELRSLRRENLRRPDKTPQNELLSEASGENKG